MQLCLIYENSKQYSFTIKQTIMNLIKYRRNLIILIGMILINILTFIFVDVRDYDDWNLIKYLLINFLWIDTIRLLLENNVRMVDRYLDEGNY